MSALPTTRAISTSTAAIYAGAWGTFCKELEELRIRDNSERGDMPVSEVECLAWLNKLAEDYEKNPSSVSVIANGVDYHHESEDYAPPFKSSPKLVIALKNYRRKFNELKADSGEAVVKRAKPMLPDDLKRFIDDSAYFTSGWRVIRDRALFLTMFAGALRVSEAANLRPADIKFVAKGGFEIRLRRTKTDQNASGKTVYACDVAGFGVQEAMQRWIKARSQEPKTAGREELFCFASSQSCETTIRQRFNIVFPTGHGFSSHSFRRGYATHAARSKVAPIFLQKHLRHTSLATTAKYYEDIDSRDISEEMAKLMGGGK